MKKSILSATLLILFRLTFGQSTEWNITGKIVSAVSKDPLPGASVFISNSTKGTFTDSTGKFSISSLANGNYNVIVSFVGYETSVYPVTINGKNEVVTIALKDTATELENVVINLKNGDRKEQLKVFRKNFIGTDKNAKQTDILNENILKMHTDESGKIFTARSNEFLLISNNALGYNIKYMLKEFSYNKKTGDLHYLGYPLFEEMKSASASQMMEWKENRKKVYQTSLLRFYRTFGKRNLIQQGYIVGDLILQENQIIQNTGASQKISATSYGFSFTLNNRQYIDTLYWPEIPYYKMMTALPGHKYLLNFSGIISVDATDAAGGTHETDYYKPGPKTSVITLKQPVEINENGLPQDPSQIIYYGYWMDLHIADLLPFDYHP